MKNVAKSLPQREKAPKELQSGDFANRKNRVSRGVAQKRGFKRPPGRSRMTHHLTERVKSTALHPRTHRRSRSRTSLVIACTERRWILCSQCASSRRGRGWHENSHPPNPPKHLNHARNPQRRRSAWWRVGRAPFHTCRGWDEAATTELGLERQILPVFITSKQRLPLFGFDVTPRDRIRRASWPRSSSSSSWSGSCWSSSSSSSSSCSSHTPSDLPSLNPVHHHHNPIATWPLPERQLEERQVQISLINRRTRPCPAADRPSGGSDESSASSSDLSSLGDCGQFVAIDEADIADDCVDTERNTLSQLEGRAAAAAAAVGGGRADRQRRRRRWQDHLQLWLARLAGAVKEWSMATRQMQRGDHRTSPWANDVSDGWPIFHLPAGPVNLC